MRRFSFLAAVVPFLTACVKAGTVTYEWDVTWVNVAPDGTSRPVIGINNQWPCPTMEANVGDTIVVKLNNKLGNQTTGLHFHGISQVDSGWMDGPSGITQCPVPPDSSITYSFLADMPGTFWYHSHNMGQYPDGLRGPLIVHDPSDPYAGEYDEEVILTVTDWYHDQSLPLVQNMLQVSNTQFRPPRPNNILVNEGLGANVTFEKGKTYRFRIISFAAFASVFVHFDSHTMQVIMTDSSYVQKTQAYQLRVAPAQRYDVLITAIDRDNRNYPFLLSLDTNRDFSTDPANVITWPYNETGYLVMKPNGTFGEDVVNVWRPKDEFSFKPLNNEALLGPKTKTIVLDFTFCRDVNDYPRACFNNETFINQRVPALYSAATTGDNNTDPRIYGAVLPYVLDVGDVVDIVVNNHDVAIHPFHLHGHQFQVLDRPGSNEGVWSGSSRRFPANPSRRDTLSIYGNSFGVMRFKVEHPGVFLFHCHIEWHVEMGMTITLIQAPDKLRDLTFPEDHIENCIKMDIPYKGNAAGNTEDYLDPSGIVTIPPTSYTGAMWTPAPTARVRARRHLRPDEQL